MKRLAALAMEEAEWRLRLLEAIRPGGFYYIGNGNDPFALLWRYHCLRRMRFNDYLSERSKVAVASPEPDQMKLSFPRPERRLRFWLGRFRDALFEHRKECERFDRLGGKPGKPSRLPEKLRQRLIDDVLHPRKKRATRRQPRRHEAFRVIPQDHLAKVEQGVADKVCVIPAGAMAKLRRDRPQRIRKVVDTAMNPTHEPDGMAAAWRNANPEVAR